ncbi:SPOR domain-containing protein [Sphingopyxis sp. 113P3]|uniref:SPOR domain-containing protein n=1 Tax=Sphingopyxis sp. (strain 113P3) TaxID=292913 RepID=UPI0006BC3F0B|nr:SPOR domain-containing protein [Sphingopyxis sp. 113P3]ALC11877.1 sporulation related protein [Sphingopyxis sp. 113P3]
MRSFRTIASLALPILAASLGAPAAASVKDGVEAWQKGDYQSAVVQWRPLAVAGDPDAQFNLGQAYKLGRGVPSDLDQAEAWYRRAAKQGHLQAEDNLGLVLFTAGRREEAMPFIAQSAARGEPRAQYVLGTAHFNGDLAAENWPLAYALTKRASDAGLQIASARLAQLDRLIPLEQRQKGLSMLPEMEKAEARARLAAVNAAAPPPPKPAPSPVKTANLPASVPGTSYTPPPVIAAPAPAPAPAPALKPVLSPAAEAAAAAAAEATAAADTAVSIAAVEAPPPVSASVKAAAPSAPGTTYAPPPEGDPLPPASAPGAAMTDVPAPAATKPGAAAAPAPRPATTSLWRAQLGAFGIESNARKLWASLEKTYPALASRQPYLVKSGKLTRLQAGGFADKAEADAFCATVRKDGQACLVVDK